MSRADRSRVPLKSRCSRKWLEPLIAGGSSREPASTQKPRETERTLGIRSVTTRRPEENSVRAIATFVPRPRLARRALLGVVAEALAVPAWAAVAAVARLPRLARLPPLATLAAVLRAL